MNTDKSTPLRTEQNTVCFSGHRFLSSAETALAKKRLHRIVREYYTMGYRWFICGGAIGFDTLCALEVIESKKDCPDIRLYLAIPCADQSSRWNESDKKTYQMIYNRADEKTILTPRYYKGCMHLRNQFMIHHASVCICWLRRFSGGTGYTVRYAVACRRNVVNLCIPETEPQVRIKEPLWNSTFTSLSVSENALIAHSIPSPAVIPEKWRNIHLRFYGKRRSAFRSLRNV